MLYWDDFTSRTNLRKYGSNSLLLYALQVKFGIDDIDSVASDALTDGSNDKKCDMIYIDEDNGVAVVAQGYIRQDASPDDIAKSNKASDLNTAIAWIFGRNSEDIPDGIKSTVISLRQAIRKDSINSIYFWYVHNCKESQQVKEEMKTVESSARTAIDRFKPYNNTIAYAIEIGNETLEKWYMLTTNPITVSEDIHLPLPKPGFEVKGELWSAYQTCISGKQLYDLYRKFEDDLFSANPRRFLGIDRRTKIKIINAGIKKSAEETPGDFWAYNNGITALTHSYDINDKDENTAAELVCHGISIINGAQTTGSLGSLDKNPSADLLVSIRVIMCSDKPTLNAIIDNNNKQNEMLPSDFRSNDSCQKRLRKAFQKYPHISYSGGLRSNQSIRGKEVFDHMLVGQILIAFNGDPVSAYSDKTFIWSDDKTYSSVFNDELTPEHIIFVYSLSKAIDDTKRHLQKKKLEGTILSSEDSSLNFLSRRGSRILLLSVISKNIEEITERKIINPSYLKFKNNNNFLDCIKWWKPIVNMVLGLHKNLELAMSAGGLDSKEKAKEVTTTIGGLITALNSMSNGLKDQMSDFINNLTE